MQAWNDSLEKELVPVSPSTEAASPTGWCAMRAFPLTRRMPQPFTEMKAVSLCSLIIFLAAAWGAPSTALHCFLLFSTPVRGCVVSKEQKAPAPLLPMAAILLGQYKERCFLHLALYPQLCEAGGVCPSVILLECSHERGQKGRGRTIIQLCSITKKNPKISNELGKASWGFKGTMSRFKIVR